MPQTGIEPVREYKSRRILSPVRLPVPPLRHTRQIAPTPLESRASMRSIASHFVITLLANHDNLLSRNGTNRARTYDPLLVRQMLSQLSYDPICSSVLQPTSLLYNYLLLNVNYFFSFFCFIFTIFHSIPLNRQAPEKESFRFFFQRPPTQPISFNIFA